MGFTGLRPDCDPRDGGRLTAYPRSRRSPGPEAYEDDRPDAVSPPTEPSVPARLATSSGSGASRRRTTSASCAGDSPVRAAFARSRSSRFSRRRCLADCFSPNNVSRLEVDPQLNGDSAGNRSRPLSDPVRPAARCSSGGAFRRRSDDPSSEPPAASREQVVRLGQLVAPRRRPCDEARALELDQRPERVRAVGYEVRLVAMEDRDARRTQPGRPEAKTQYPERLRVQAGNQTAEVFAHDPERKPPESARG
jgi:hypothetical protein